MRALMYPVLKDDFALVETYTPSSLSRLPCPVSVLGGATDVRTNPGSLNAWSHCAPPGECSVRVFPGGHNYLFKEAESKAPFLAYLRTDLQHVIDGTRLDTGLLEEPAPLPETASLGAIAHSNGSLTSGECRGDSTAQQKSPASTAASAEHQQLPTSSGAERAGLPPSSTPSLCSEAGATVASGSSYALGPRGHTGLSVATMSRNGDRGDGASDGQPPSPLWEAPPPSKGCFQCVFCSWSH